MNKCGNIACQCDVELLDQMCSDFCKNSDKGDAHDVTCSCAHAQCKEKIAAELGASQH